MGAAVLTASRTTHAHLAAAPIAAPTITVSPSDGTAAVAPAALVTAHAADATLTGIAVTAADGTTLAGTLSADGRTWTATARPAYDTSYRFSGIATGPGGTTPVAGSFHTVAPKHLVEASAPTITEDATVGVAAPIEVRFDRVLDDAGKVAAERALTVTTSAPVQGSWGWLADTEQGSRVHWRPKVYWPAHTQVTVRGEFAGRRLGAAGFGANDLERSFTIGRSQIVKADVTSHRMIVVRDGRVVTDIPVSYGLESDPRRVTRSGVHVVTSKSATVFMTNRTFGYENVEMHWAVRISDNGEYIHANPASSYAQGKRNVTHGCVNLSTADAKAYFATALYGDPVEVTNSTVPLSKADGDIYDWAIPWAQWQSMSALGTYG
ncbi:MAG: Ig-like domain-containing protein [Pseudonocardia sp.]|nr:Ig-like domain-containing protein [Pseudonocardia sp.]